MFIPTTKEEIKKLAWKQLDVVLVSGDTYIDTPYDGIVVIAKVLLSLGLKVGLIPQPDINSSQDITRFGEPLLFWGISSGCVDSMVANYTSLKKKKKSDDLTPGGLNNKRPDRAILIYANLIRQYFKNTKPIIIGGIESSLRRIAHYDYWSDSIRRSILFDSKADILVYGEGEKTITELVHKFKLGESIESQRGICYISKENTRNDYIELPSYQEVAEDKNKFIEMFRIFYKNNDPLNANGLIQKHADRYLVQNPPNYYLDNRELDKIYEFDYEWDVHPYYKSLGKVKALDTVKFSITSHRGCFGECNFCSIAVHHGRTIRSRTEDSIINQIKKMINHPNFKGNIYDVGGATANMYRMNCKLQSDKGSCKEKRCLSPELCKSMSIDHKPLLNLLERILKLEGIKKVFIGSGLRYDLIVQDKKSGWIYLEKLIEEHISGQLKIAPEHTENKILSFMGKPQRNLLIQFKDEFYKINKQKHKNQFLTYYFIAAHPGCEPKDMEKLKYYIKKELRINPEQVQIFNPTPSTYSSLMYYTGIDILTGKEIFVDKDLKSKRKQKEIIIE
jgi:uncharacterized radical SAM protein YgiQ